MTSTAPSPLATYREGLAAGELRFQRCGGCDRAVFYPRVVCPFCGSCELVWMVAGGGGVVYATTAMRPRDGAPYNVCLVDLDEGFRMMSRVEGPTAEAVRIGDRVRLRVVEDDGPVPVFTPAGSS